MLRIHVFAKYIATCWLACAGHINNNGARNTGDASASISPSLAKRFPPRKGKIVSFFFFVPSGETLRRDSRSSLHLRADFHPPYGAYARAQWRKMCNKKRTRAVINHREIFPQREAALFYPLHHLLSASREIVSCNDVSTRNCSLSRMSCLHVGCYDRRVGEGICIYRGNSVSHRPGLSYIDQHSSLITMLQLQINKVLIGPYSIHRLDVFVCFAVLFAFRRTGLAVAVWQHDSLAQWWEMLWNVRGQMHLLIKARFFR